MTEITSIRQAVRPRPLGLLKDDSQYYRITSKFQSSKTGSNEASDKFNQANQQVIKGTLQQAALINIVAAVNETFGSDDASSVNDRSVVPGSPVDSLNNTIAVVSSLLSPRERTISIPTTQVVFEMPVESVQRKPVYYKHSGDEEVHKKESSIKVFSKERSKLIPYQPYIASEKVMKRIPFKTPCFEKSSETQNKKADSIPETPKANNSKSWSPVRRLGAWKRPEFRAVHQLSKCEAVDIMDTDSIRRSQNDTPVNPDPTKLSAEEKLKIIPPSPVNPFPFYRAKSLPAVFPVKTTKPMSTQLPRKPDRVIQRPRSRGYYSPSLDARKVVNLSGGFVTDLMNSGSRLNSENENVSSFKLDLTKTKSVLKSPYSVSGSEISPAEVRGRAFGQETPRHEHYMEPFSFQETRMKTDLSQTKENYHPVIMNTMIGRPKSTSSTGSNTSRSRYTPSVQSRRSCIANKPAAQNISGRRSPKKVKFARRPSSSSVVSAISDEPIAKINAFGGSSIVQTPSSNITAYSPGPQPMSAQELLRLKQKFIPANVHVELANQSTYHFSSHAGMKIKGIQHKSSDVVLKLSSSSESDREDSEGDRDPDGAKNSVKVKYEPEFADEERKYSGDIFTKPLSDFDDDIEDNVSDDADDDFSGSDARHEISYKLVKAVDLDSYSEFEHKKMRKVLHSSLNSNKSDPSKAHFVKVTLKEGE